MSNQVDRVVSEVSIIIHENFCCGTKILQIYKQKILQVYKGMFIVYIENHVILVTAEFVNMNRVNQHKTKMKSSETQLSIIKFQCFFNLCDSMIFILDSRLFV